MMSDEEDVGGNTFKVCGLEWRSDQLNELLKDLDSRADGGVNRARPRKNRIVGTPQKQDAPIGVKEWMLSGK